MIRIKGLILGGLLTLVFLPSAQAYLDPGSGSIIIQAVFAALAAIVIFFTHVKNLIIGLVQKILRKGPKLN